MGAEYKSQEITQVMRFLNLCMSLGCDSFIFGIFGIIRNVELFYILKFAVGISGICVQIHSYFFSSKICLAPTVFLLEQTKSIEVDKAL